MSILASKNLNKSINTALFLSGEMWVTPEALDMLIADQ